ncbi:MAG: DeoR/GlpR transcriptional regulator [Anaerolineaceae bacterium]|jgi:DeoR/GlpR family transcriptional regulator of sugar metabolism|nr:MAG: DeoR/GlpR transcriptional regulator [Anaerolineaceae bacterium]
MVMNEISAAERRSLIAQMVTEKGQVYVSALVEMFNVSEVSIRRDLTLLEESRRLKRIHGGAIPIPGNFRTDSFEEKEKLHNSAKERIGQVAASLIQQGDIILLDSGTTTLQIVRNTPASLRVSNMINMVTNSMPLVPEVLTWPSPNLTVLGGIYLPDYQATVGPQTLNQLKELTADIAFLGTDGLTLEGGATTANVLMAEVDRMMADHARKTVLVTDSSKFGRKGFVPVKGVSAYHTIITDAGAPTDMVKAIRDMGVEVLLV